ncbi:MAG: hypothetical protein ACI4O7_02685 [Aristaeellaceae bacterium]
MKKFLALLLCLSLVFSCACASAVTFGELQDMLRTDDSDPDAQTEGSGSGLLITCTAQDGLTVLDCNCIIDAEDYSSFLDCYVYAVVRNDGSEPVAVDGSILVTDTKGNDVEEQSYLFAEPDVLNPGEVTFIAEELLITRTETVSLPEHLASLSLTVCADPYAYSTDAPVHTTVSAELAEDVDIFGLPANVVRFTITNDTGAPLRTPSVAAALYDSDGKLVMTVNADTGYDMVILPAGGTLIIQSELYSYVATYLEQTGRTLSAIDAIAYGN